MFPPRAARFFLLGIIVRDYLSRLRPFAEYHTLSLEHGTLNT